MLAILSMAFIFPQKHKTQITYCAKLYNLDENLIYAVAFCESGFNPKAKSNKGAVGIMQLMPSTAKWCCERMGIEYSYQKLYDPNFNIRIGSYYLSYLKDKFKTEKQILWAYNAGEGKIKDWTNDADVYTETRAYVKKINFIKTVYGFLY